MENERRSLLDTFDNPRPDRDYTIVHNAHEFTSVCPKTGQPDFGEIVIRYIADERCVELKSLKMYLQSYRNEGVFYEDVVNRILDDLVGVLNPRQMTVTGQFSPRGGMHSVISAHYPPMEELDEFFEDLEDRLDEENWRFPGGDE